MPRTPKGAQSKENIIDAALKVFMRKGYKGTSLQDLCEAAGLTKGAIYHHFSGKEDLYEQALERWFGYSGSPDWTVSIGSDSLRALVRRGFEELDLGRRRILELMDTDQDEAILQFYSFLYEATRTFDKYQKRMDELDAEKHREMTAAIRRAQGTGEVRSDLDPEATALEFDALLQQLLYLRFVNPHMKTDSRLLERIEENYWRRLAAWPTGDETAAGPLGEEAGDETAAGPLGEDAGDDAGSEVTQERPKSP